MTKLFCHPLDPIRLHISLLLFSQIFCISNITNVLNSVYASVS